MEKNIQATRVDIVVPVYNEEETVEALAREINAAMAPTDWEWSCIWVDDGSIDKTPEILDSLCTQDGTHHRFVLHDGNFGQSAALYTGFSRATAPIIVTLDGDGQNDPQDIPRVVSKLVESDAGLVNGVRVNRADTLVRKISSKIGNSFRRWVTHDGVTDVGCSLRAFRAKYVSYLVVFKGMHRFLPALMLLNGCEKVLEIPVNHRPRQGGVSKYGIGNRLWVGVFDLVGIVWVRKRGIRPAVKENI
jgi:glycosyltransferase involved in cell wall biosynthesis